MGIHLVTASSISFISRELGQIDAYEGIYDEKTGVFTREQDGLGMKVTFTDKKGKITADLILYQGEDIFAKYTGEKM